jgi:hypothetical protein
MHIFTTQAIKWVFLARPAMGLLLRVDVDMGYTDD